MIRERIGDYIDLSRPGLEIGALDRPVVRRDMGPVEYVDHFTREELQRWYDGHPIDLEGIVEVDHIWGERSLLDCVGGQRTYAWVMASHVIEHVPDLFGWLREIAEVLVDGGVGAFIVPDKRYTFDIARRTTAGPELVDAYVRRLRRPSPRQVYDHFRNIRETPESTGEVSAQRELEILDACWRAETGGEYIDAHCWVFTPRVMAECLDLASRLGLLPFAIERLEPTALGAAEFMLTLRRLPADASVDAQQAAFAESLARLDLPDEADAAPPPIAETVVETVESRLIAARLAAIEASTSWRLTAPLRAAVTAVRGLGRGR